MDAAREARLKDKIAALSACLNGSPGDAVDMRFFSDDYRPHCAPFVGALQLASGASALRDRLVALRSIPHKVYLTIADGDFVWAHVRYDGVVPVAGIDIFRFDDADLIAEHWNVRQALPHDTANGWDRFGGEADTQTVTSEERRAEMKALLRRSQIETWGQAGADKVDVYYDRAYVQHNPDMPGGFERIRHLIATEMKQYVELTGKPFPIEFIMMGANGDVVFLYYSVPMVGIGRNAGEMSRNADIFRISAQDKLIEHWDVLQMGSEPLPDHTTLY